MTTAVTVQAVWEAEVLGECVRCGGEMTIGPVAHAIEIAPGQFLCDPCFFFVFDGSRARAKAALGLEPSGDDDGDGPDGEGGPAAPAARPSTLTLVAAGRGPAGYELSPAEEAELDEFEALVLASAPAPAPCIACGRPASPAVETDAGVWCFACTDGGAGGAALQRAVRLDRTFSRMVAARLRQTVACASAETEAMAVSC